MNYQIKKVVIPAAGIGTRFLPITKIMHKELLPILNKPLIEYLIKEAIDANLEEIIIVISPRKIEICKYFLDDYKLIDKLLKRGKIEFMYKVSLKHKPVKVFFILQKAQLGFAHAIFQASDILNNEPFAVILGDNLIVSKKPAISQLMQIYQETQSSVLGLQRVKKADVSKYGIVEPLTRKKSKDNCFLIKGAVEKPKPTEAPSKFAILGRYIFTPKLLEILKKVSFSIEKEYNVLDAFSTLLEKEPINGYLLKGKFYDFGTVHDFVKAQIDFSLKDKNLHLSIMKYLKKLI